MVQDSAMLYTGSFEMRIIFLLSYDGVGSPFPCHKAAVNRSVWAEDLSECGAN